MSKKRQREQSQGMATNMPFFGLKTTENPENHFPKQLGRKCFSPGPKFRVFHISTFSSNRLGNVNTVSQTPGKNAFFRDFWGSFSLIMITSEIGPP